MAERYWRRATARSASGSSSGASTSEQPWRSVVGVTENVRHFGLDSETRREFYLPYAQAAWPVMTIVAKTVGEPMMWQSSLRDVVKRVDPDLPVARVRSMEAVVGASVNWRETPMRLLDRLRDRSACCWRRSASTACSPITCRSARARSACARRLAPRGGNSRALVVRQSMLPIVAGVVARRRRLVRLRPSAAGAALPGAARRSASDRAPSSRC